MSELKTLTATEAKKILNRMYESVIGQASAKAWITELILGAIADGGFLKPTAWIGAPGLGKTHLFRLLMAGVRSCLGRNVIYYPTGEECGTRIQFIENCLLPQMHDKDAVLFIDEVQGAKAPVKNMIRALLEPTADRQSKTMLVLGDAELTWNPFRNSIFVATNKVDQLDEAFKSRFILNHLHLYSTKEIEKMMEKNLADKKIKFSDNSLTEFAACNRGTARDLVHWGDTIQTYLAQRGRRNVTKADVAAIIKLRETYPLGVTQHELNTLLILEAFGDMQLKELAGRNLVEPKEQNENEKYLRFRGLMMIESKRHITQAGREYLTQLRKDKYTSNGPVKL